MKRKRLRHGAIGIFLLLLIGRADAGPVAAREVLENGMVLLHAEKKALPIVTVAMAIRAGSLLDPPERAGLSSLTVDLLGEGTARRTSKEISEEIDFVGGSLGTSGGSDYVSVTLTVLKKDVELGFDLLSDIVMNPSFREEEVTRRKAIVKSQIIQEREDPGEVAEKAYLKAVYGDHPYGRRLEGEEDTVERISRQDVAGFYSAYYAPNNAMMAVVGDLSRDEVRGLIKKYFGGWKKKEVPAVSLPDPSPGAGPKTIKISKDLVQSSIILGHLGIRRENPDYYAVSVMNYILGGGGFASRLMDNIRDNRGLAYDVRSSFLSGKYAGVFQASVQTKNQTANDAIDEILKEMERIRTEPVSDRELEDARSYLTGSFPLRIDTNSKIASLLITVEHFGLGLDYPDRYKDYILSVKKDDILRVAQQYLRPGDYVLVVVGNIEKAALRY